MNNTGSLIGTGFVARDMMQIVEALNEDGLLRYWGFSYGTVLGETVAAMFPDKVDKLVLDGVLNPHDYYAGRDVEQCTDSDATFDGFFTSCVAAPELCPLAHENVTAKALKDKVYGLLYRLKYHPIAAGPEISTQIITYDLLKQAVEFAMYNTVFWPSLATAIDGIFAGNYTALLTSPLFSSQDSSVFINYGFDATTGIRASDVRPRTNKIANLYPLIDEFYSKSQIFGDVLASPALAYAQWPFHAKGAYDGDFTCIKTRNPVLFIGNTFDPLTPFVSAKNASAGFEGSVVLEHGGYGVRTPIIIQLASRLTIAL